MNQLLVSAPAITMAEAVFLVAAVTLLLAVPAGLAWVEDRRRRPEPEPTYQAGAEVGSGAATAAVGNTVADAAPPEPPWSPWPVAPPAPSVDPWHPNEELTSPMTHAATNETHAATTHARMSIDEPTANPQHSPTAPPFGAVQSWRTATERYAMLAALPTPEPSGEPTGCLESLREITLATWPGPVTAMPPEVQSVWTAGQTAFATWKSRVCQLQLAIAEEVMSYCLARVETDGVVVRLHFLLFDQLWPTQPEEARAVAVVDIEPLRGPLAWCVLPASARG